MRRALAAAIVGLLAAIVGLLAASAQAQTITLRKWQDMGALVDRQSKAINELKGEVSALKLDQSLIIQRYDMTLRMLVIHACAHNEKVAAMNVVFDWIKPIPLGSHTCPPPGSLFYIPGYLSAGGPPIPPLPSDSFERTDVGTSWAGTATIVSGKMRATGKVLWTPTVKADQAIEAKVTASPAAWGYYGLVVRASVTGSEQYRFTVSSVENKYDLEYMNAANEHTSLLSGPVTYVAGAKMRVEVKGSSLTVWYNNVKLGTVNDTRLASGSVGVISIATSGGYAEVDDVLVQELD